MSLPPEYLATVFRAEAPENGWPRAFGIVTAWHPMGEIADDTANQAADNELRSQLIGSGIFHSRVTGGDSAFMHYEPGWAIESDFATVLNLGRHYRQLAIWWIEDDALFLVDCSTGESLSLSSFAARLR